MPRINGIKKKKKPGKGREGTDHCLRTGVEFPAHSSGSDLPPGPVIKAPPVCQQAAQNWDASLAALLVSDVGVGKSLNPSKPVSSLQMGRITDTTS